MGKLLEELKRRKVFRVAAVYGVVAWLLIQVASTVLPTFNAPAWVNQTITLLFILGFPLAVILAWAYEITPEGVKSEFATQTVTTTANNTDRKLTYAMFALLLVAVGFQIADRFLVDQNVPDSATQRSSASLSAIPGASLRANLAMGELPGNSLEFLVPDFSLTDDGSKLIYSSWNGGRGKIEIRDLNSGAVSTVWEQQGSYPYEVHMSPDGKHLLFKRVVARGATFPFLVVLPLEETGSTTLVEIAQVIARSDAAWLDNDQVLFQNREGAFQRYSVSAGASTTIDDTSFTPNSLADIRVLPGQEMVMFTHYADGKAIEAFNLTDGSRTPIVENAYAPTYLAPGYLLFMRDESLWATRFDIATLQPQGTAVRLISGIESLDYQGDANYSLSQQGRLVYLPGELRARSAASKHLLWIDRSGNESPLELPTMDFRYISLSPDGRRLSFTRTDARTLQSDIWTHSFDQPGIINQVTYNGGVNSVWSADGSQLFFAVREPGTVWVVDANGLADARQIYRSEGRALLSQHTADGTFLYSQIRGLEPLRASLDALKETDGIWLNTTLVDRPFIEAGSKLSPDGRWLAYHSGDTGDRRQGIFVRPYPAVESDRWQISTMSAAAEPLWSDDGRLHFVAPDPERSGEYTWFTVTLDTENNMRVLEQQELPLGPLAWNGYDLPNYAVAPDGERVLVSRPGPAPDMISAVNRTRQINLTLVDNFITEIESALASQ